MNVLQTYMHHQISSDKLCVGIQVLAGVWSLYVTRGTQTKHQAMCRISARVFGLTTHSSGQSVCCNLLLVFDHLYLYMTAVTKSAQDLPESCDVLQALTDLIVSVWLGRTCGRSR
jgi:hypothetical protein